MTETAAHSSASHDTLLLCVDMQPVFIAAMSTPASVLNRCKFAVAGALGLGLPVAFTEQVPEKLGGTSDELLQLAPQASVWPKTTFSALADAALMSDLRTRGISHLLLCGIETPVCIYQTAISALANDLQVTILSDAIGARREVDASVCLAALRHLGAHVLPSETVFYALLGDVHHPFFRSYTKLVKQHAENRPVSA